MNQHLNKSISISQLTNKSQDRVIMLTNIIATPPYLLNLINILFSLPAAPCGDRHPCMYRVASQPCTAALCAYDTQIFITTQ